MFRPLYSLRTALLIGSALITMPGSALAQPVSTRFQCIEKRPSGYATVARRGDLITPPLLTWDATLGGGWTPQKRCEAVGARFNQAVALNGGKLSYLRLSYGPLNGQTVICYANSDNRPCSSSTLLFTLSGANASDPEQVLVDLKTFALSASGNAIQESPPQLLYTHADGRSYFDLGEWGDRVEWRSISEDAAIDDSDLSTQITAPDPLPTTESGI